MPVSRDTGIFIYHIQSEYRHKGSLFPLSLNKPALDNHLVGLFCSEILSTMFNFLAATISMRVYGQQESSCFDQASPTTKVVTPPKPALSTLYQSVWQPGQVEAE